MSDMNAKEIAKLWAKFPNVSAGLREILAIGNQTGIWRVRKDIEGSPNLLVTAYGNLPGGGWFLKLLCEYGLAECTSESAAESKYRPTNKAKDVDEALKQLGL